MTIFVEREDRKQALLSVRLNIDGNWQDATIQNLSSKGLMVQCSDPPGRGAFVEMRRGANLVVAQVRWNDEGRFGALSQTRLDLRKLSENSHRSAPERRERRAKKRIETVHTPSIEERGEANLRLARLIDNGALLIVAIAGALLVAQIANETLPESLLAASAAMAGRG